MPHSVMSVAALLAQAPMSQYLGPARWLLDARPSGDQVACSIPAGSGNIDMEIDHEMFSTDILSLPLIQEGQLFWRKNVHRYWLIT